MASRPSMNINVFQFQSGLIKMKKEKSIKEKQEDFNSKVVWLKLMAKMGAPKKHIFQFQSGLIKINFRYLTFVGES